MIRFRLFRIAIVAALFIGAGIGVTGQQPAALHAPAPPPRFTDADRVAKLATAFPEIDRAFAQYATTTRSPGLAWGVVIDGKLVHTGAVGYRDVATKAPVDADTVFRIASMTKSFTAVAILRLRDEGKLSLDDLAERYIPELAGLKYPTTDSPRLTIRLLLSHAEGFPEDNPWGDRQLAQTDAQMGEMMKRGIPFSNAPGMAYEYSNYGFAMLGRIVARVSGVPYRDYIQKTILAPLGMTSTTLDPSRVPADRVAHGYGLQDGQWKDEPSLADGAFGAMGGMLTSINDLAKYVGFLSTAFPPRDGADNGPIRRSSAREMQTISRPAPAIVTRGRVDEPYYLNASGYGFGLRIWQSCNQSHLVSHGGGLPGFGSHMRWLPEHGVAIISMSNLTYNGPGRATDQAVNALAATGGLQPRVPQPSPALIDAKASVSQLVARWDDALADRIAADNLYLDESKARRRATMQNMLATHGVCKPEAAFEVENALRGVWKMPCDRGWLRVGITLAPTTPPLVQSLSIASVLPPSSLLTSAVETLVSMFGHPDEAKLGALVGPGLDARDVASQLAAAGAWGAVTRREVTDGNGASTLAIRLVAVRGTLVLRLTLNELTGRLSRVVLAPAGDATCGQ
jgi:CubicO group peptidase (beta-lactamase class C family)